MQAPTFTPSPETPCVDLTVKRKVEGTRLDQYLVLIFSDLSRSAIQRSIEAGAVLVNGRPGKASYKIRYGDQIRVWPPPPTHDLPVPEDIPLDVLFEDEDLAVINKPADMVVHPAKGHWSGTLANAIQFRFGKLSHLNGEYRPGIVHRLDRDTSGVLLLARNARAAAELGEAFRRKDCRKIYWAIVVGVPKPERGRVDLALAKQAGQGGERMRPDEEGKEAVTEYRVLDRAGREAAWLELAPLTGRTHQLRAHCAALGTPILGDAKYGGWDAFLGLPGMARRLHLHARRIRLPRPDGRWIDVAAPPPAHMVEDGRSLGFALDQAGQGT